MAAKQSSHQEPGNRKSDAARRTMRARLEQIHAELQEITAAGAEAAGAVELDQGKVGRLSRMDALQSQAMAQATQQRRQLTLRLVERALNRLQTGDYGRCVECDEMINPQRLEIDPAAELCIRCAEAAA